MSQARFSWRADVRGPFADVGLTTEMAEGLESIVGESWSVTEPDLSAHGADRWPLAVRRRHLGLELPRPRVVIWPDSAAQVAELFRWARRYDVALVTRGAGSGVVGGAVPVHGEAVISTARMTEIVSFDQVSGVVTVEAGVMGGDLERWLNEHGFTLGHYPQSLDLSTVGGWVATRASGTFSSGYGNIEDIVRGLRVVLPSGKLVEFAPIPRAATGPNLRDLFVGSEGAFGIVAEVDLQVRRAPQSRLFDSFAFETVGQGLEATRALAQDLHSPALVRLNDPVAGSSTLEAAGARAGLCPLILAWDGPVDVVEALRDHSERVCLDHGGQALGAAAAAAWYDNRFDVSRLEQGIERSDGIADTIELATSWTNAERLHSSVIGALQERCDQVSGHFSHVYPTGTSLYVIFFLEADEREVESRYVEAWRVALAAAVDAGASISHHHGVGLMRADWMPLERSTDSDVLHDMKRLLDPHGILNPGKLISASD